MNDMTRPGAIDPPYLYPDYRSTTLRSRGVRALIGDVPNQLSAGVRSQNSDKDAHQIDCLLDQTVF